MTSLGEVYETDRRREASRERVYAGVALFCVGAVLVVAGILVATTGLLRGGGTTIYDVREWGGLLAGVGVPAVFLGILIVLPSDRETRVAAGVGAAVATLGLALFSYAYPCRWSGASCAPGMADLTLPTVAVYALGLMVTTWYLFVGIATFKRRNDPGGTVSMTKVTGSGETTVIEREPTGKGSAGLFGSGTSDAGTTASVPGGNAGYRDAEVMGGTTADGGTASADINEVGAGVDGDPDGVPGDPYCGNCRHFEYVRTEQGMQPYCGAHDELMDDMDPCESWEPNGA